MNYLLKQFIGWAFERHIPSNEYWRGHHADYEVCPDWFCRLAYWCEQRFDPYHWDDGEIIEWGEK